MNTGDVMKKYFEKRVEAIDSFLKKPAQVFTLEDFHKLRVEIKKLKALLKLIDFCEKDFKEEKTFKLFEGVFVQAGKVREFQLEEAALNKYALPDSLSKYRNNLKKLRQKERKIFFSLINKRFIRGLKKEHDKVKPFIARADKSCVTVYLDTKSKKIERLFEKKKLKTQEVHKLRKHLKEFYYLRKCVDMKPQNELFKKTDTFQELLGQWHDCRVINNQFKSAIDGGMMKPAEVKLLEKVKTKLVSDTERLFTKINIAREELTIM